MLFPLYSLANNIEKTCFPYLEKCISLYGISHYFPLQSHGILPNKTHETSIFSSKVAMFKPPRALHPSPPLDEMDKVPLSTRLCQAGDR